MAQIFHRSANTLSRASIVGALLLAGFVLVAIGGIVRSPYFTNQGVHREQPVPFSHQHHVAGLGIDCRYCHTSVEESSFAGIPPTRTCMNCHSQIFANSPFLEPVRESLRSGRSIQWNRVHDLPDFVYFNHSVHVKKGMGCETCHGRIDQMQGIQQKSSLQMEWCLDCHRNPEQFVRPREAVFTMGYEPAGNQLEIGRKLVQEYKIQSLTTCSTCHR